MALRMWRVFGMRMMAIMVLGVFFVPLCRGGLPTADWLPDNVKFHFSIADYPASKPLFDQTALGELLQDESMAPFWEDFSGQLRSRARASWPGAIWVDLGIDWKRFIGVPSGEVAWAMFNVDELPAAVFIADVTDKADEVASLCDEIATAMAEQKAEQTVLDVDGTTLTVYRLPRREGMDVTTLVHFVRNDFFVATHHVELGKRIVPRVGVAHVDSLGDSAEYKHVMSQSRAASTADPHATLYLVPFDCVELIHNAAREEKVDVEESPPIYRTQGLDALEAVGATIRFGGPNSDISFCGSLYAPKPWSKSMRMFDLRNGALEPAPWITDDIAAYWSLNVHAESVYENVGPLFDEVVAQGATGAWEDVLIALREDEYGPQLDLEKEVFAFLRGPAVVIEKDALPATPESPRVLLALNVADQAALAAGIKKAMQDDPLISRREVAGTTCYYSVSEDDEDKLLWIICVARGHAFMANDFAILTPVLEGKAGAPLAKETAFQRAVERWQEDLTSELSGAMFCRLERWAKVRYELLRGGKALAPRKTFGGMLSNFFGGELREAEEPEIDASKLPPFEKIRQYFGTLDAASVTVESGWIVCGQLCR